MTILTEATQAIAGTIVGDTTMAYLSGETASFIFYIVATVTFIEMIPTFVSVSDLMDSNYDDSEAVFSHLKTA